MKFIIENRSELPMALILEMVISVIAEGRASNNGKQYCYLSIFVHEGKEYQVSTDLNPKSDRFVVTYYKEHKPSTREGE